ncbi:hypothetical protein BCR44DRAFT_1449052, partial [Catenaria anguillulae PL171]
VALLHGFFTFLRKHYGDTAITPNMHFALHYDKSIDNTGPTPATWLFRFEQANGEFVSLNNPGRQMPEVVMRAFIIERAADLFLAKPAHSHNEHELELLAAAVKSRQPTRLAADLLFPSPESAVTLDSPSVKYLDPGALRTVGLFLDQHFHTLQGYGIDRSWSSARAFLVQTEVAKSCQVRGQQLRVGKSIVIVNASEFGGGREDVALLIDIFKVAGVVLGAFDVAVPWAVESFGVHAEIVERLKVAGIKYAAFPRVQDRVLLPLAVATHRIAFHPRAPLSYSPSHPDIRGRPFFVVGCVPIPVN